MCMYPSLKALQFECKDIPLSVVITSHLSLGILDTRLEFPAIFFFQTVQNSEGLFQLVRTRINWGAHPGVPGNQPVSQLELGCVSVLRRCESHV